MTINQKREASLERGRQQERKTEMAKFKIGDIVKWVAEWREPSEENDRLIVVDVYEDRGQAVVEYLNAHTFIPMNKVVTNEMIELA